MPWCSGSNWQGLYSRDSIISFAIHPHNRLSRSPFHCIRVALMLYPAALYSCRALLAMMIGLFLLWTNSANPGTRTLYWDVQRKTPSGKTIWCSFSSTKNSLELEYSSRDEAEAYEYTTHYRSKCIDQWLLQSFISPPRSLDSTGHSTACRMIASTR